MTLQITRKQFTAAQYHQMIDVGILTERDRVELLQGEIIEMSPIGRQHAACVDRLTELFIRELGNSAIVRVQNPIQLSDRSEPQPDFAILRRRSDFYANGHPQPQDIFALIEVSDTTADFDRTVKVPLYAQNSIAEVWIVDLNAEVVQTYREPSSTGYQRVQDFYQGQRLAFRAFADIQFAVAQMLR